MESRLARHLTAPILNTVLQILTFIARHFLFVVLATTAGWVIWTMAYFVLLIVAVVTNKGTGGPLALPGGILAVMVACVSLGWGVFAPASAVGAVFCAAFRLPRIAAIPVVCVAAFIFCYLIHWACLEWMTTRSMPPILTVLENYGIYLGIPLGVYWWLTEGPGAVFDAFRRWIQGPRRPQST